MKARIPPAFRVGLIILALAGTQSLAVQIQAMENDDLIPLCGLVVRLALAEGHLILKCEVLLDPSAAVPRRACPPQDRALAASWARNNASAGSTARSILGAVASYRGPLHLTTAL